MQALKRNLYTSVVLGSHALSYAGRALVWVSGKFAKPGFTGLVPRSSAVFARYAYEEVTPAVLLSTKVESGLVLEQIKPRLEKMLSKKKNETMRCHVSKYFGFYSWFREENFTLEDHLYHIEGKGKLEISSFYRRVMSEPFFEGRSPWVFYLVSNAVNEGSQADFFIIKIHHVVMDAYSLLGLACNEIFECSKEFNVELTRREITAFSKLRQEFRSTFEAAALIAGERLASSKQGSKNLSFSVLGPQGSNKNSQFYVTSKSVPIKVLKKVKDKLEISFQALVVAGITKAVRDVLLKKGISCEGARPDFLFITGLPNHPGGLCNHFSHVMLNLPVELEVGKDAAAVINEQLIKARNERLDVTNAKVGQILGGRTASKLPPELPPGLNLLGSDVIGTRASVRLLGKEGEDMNIWAGPNGDLGIHFYGFSYNNEWKINLAVHESVLESMKEAKFVADSVVEHIIQMED